MSRLGILAPLRHRDYRLVAIASLVSLLGDGFFLVAIALQVYAIDPRPVAMSMVGIAWTGSALLCLLVGGWASDHYPRRRIMIGADLVRAAAIGTLGLLSIAGVLQLWHMLVLGAVFGGANAFFNPASTAVVPDLLPAEDLPRANAFLGVAKPAMIRLAGPATGGLLVAAAGPGSAFLFDAGTFVVSAALLVAMRSANTPAHDSGARDLAQTRRDVVEGMRFVRSHTWCWAWLVGAAASLLLYYGPLEVLLPYVLAVELGFGEAGAATRLALIFSAGGLGSILVSILVGQKNLPRRFMTWMYIAEAAGIAAIAVYGLTPLLWPMVAASFFLNGMFAFTEIGWLTTLQRLVPGRLLGRVSSLDWLTSIGLMPLSFALAGPVAQVAGARLTLVVAGAAGSVVLLALLAVPGARDPEKQGPPADAEMAEALVGEEPRTSAEAGIVPGWDAHP